jgi:hypothetical protein
MERAARIYEYGPPEVLRIEPIDVPAPGPGEALIRHTAIGLNFVEVYFRRGTFQAPALPAVLGNEGAGIVEAVGPGVTGVNVGDRVVYADGPLGAYATVRLYPADQLVRIPDAISDAQAAASFLRGVTARMLLKNLLAQSGLRSGTPTVPNGESLPAYAVVNVSLVQKLDLGIEEPRPRSGRAGRLSEPGVSCRRTAAALLREQRLEGTTPAGDQTATS